MPAIFVWLAWPVFIFGGILCILNFKIFLDWAIYRLRKRPRQSYKHVSAIPIIGSLLVALTLRAFDAFPAVEAVGIVLIAIDTGGIHWSIVGICYQLLLALWRRIGW
jgi:hypothetical protein